MIDTIGLLAAGWFLCASPGVHDGDTWTCASGTKVRAWGIDAPELATGLGPSARGAMATIIGGETLICDKRGTTWGRVSAYCLRPDGGDVAADLMRAGLALDCPRYSRGAYAPLRPADAPNLPPRHASCEVRR